MAEPNEDKGQANEGTKEGTNEDLTTDSTVIEDSPEGETEVTVDDDEGPPGGTDGTAVYARKQHQEAKRLARQLSMEREGRIRLEERLRALESTRTVKPEVRVWSAAEVKQGVDQGLITPYDATVYLANTTAKETYRK